MAARGRPPGPGEKPWRDAIRRAVNRHVAGEGDPKALDKLADKLVAEGLEGSIPAMQEIGNRLDGKPVQPVGGDEDSVPVRMVIEWAKPSES